MGILIITSSSFYDKISPIATYLKNKGHEVFLPNTYDNPNIEEEVWKKGDKEHSKLIKDLFQMSEERIKSVDAVLCLNFEKHEIKNYIGGATYIELYEAFKNNKKIYLYHDIPKGILFDEISGFNPIIINENLDRIGD